MSGITISTLNLANDVKESLLQEINFLNREGVHVEFTEKNTDKFYFLDVNVNEDDLHVKTAQEKILRYYLANIITDLLMNNISKEFIQRVTRNKYRFLSPAESKVVLQNAYTYLNNLHENGDIGKTLYRHNQILSEVNQYLDINSNLFLEGFFRFRLKEYFSELEKSVELSMDNFLVEQEYHEFIRLLQYFVEVQEPRIDEVHVLIKDKQHFYMLDEEKQPINQEQLQGILTDLNQDTDYDDLLLSALITISPRKLILHLSAKTEIVDTIINVFQERVVFCKGCPLCSGPISIPKLGIETYTT
jgi:putative sporulation protein YtxC